MAEHATKQQDSTADTLLGYFTVAGSNSVYLVFPAYRHQDFSSNYAAWLLQEVGQKVAMHAVALKPRYLSPDTVPAEALEGSPDTTPLHSCLWEAA